MSTTMSNEQILDAIGNKTVLELADLIESFKTKFNVSVMAAQPADRRQRPHWEPPVDVYAGSDQVLIEVALPGAPADRMELILGPGELVIRGERTLPNRPVGTALQRIEIPYGRFERRLALGPGLWNLADQRLADGCLQLLLARRR